MPRDLGTEICGNCGKVKAAYASFDNCPGFKSSGRFKSNKESIDLVNSPPHYTNGKIECIEAIESALTPEELQGYLKGNIIKYLWREAMKGGAEDIKKARWYVGRLLGEHLGSEA